MRKSFLLSAALAASVSAMAAAVPVMDRAQAPAPVVRPEARRLRLPDGRPVSRRNARKPGPGWSPRQVQRMAAKRRNQARNRAAHRGSR